MFPKNLAQKLRKSRDEAKITQRDYSRAYGGLVPDHELVGEKLDEILKENFLGKVVVVRCIGSQDHPGIGLNKLTDIIMTTGADKYDAAREGVGYQEFNKKGIKVDFYGEPVKIIQDAKVMAQAIWEMHHSAIGDRGFGVHVDLVLVYDAAKVQMVMNLYDFHETSDGFVFTEPDNRVAALLGLIRIN